jgi:hypothetical protein
MAPKLPDKRFGTQRLRTQALHPSHPVTRLPDINQVFDAIDGMKLRKQNAEKRPDMARVGLRLLALTEVQI